MKMDEEEVKRDDVSSLVEQKFGLFLTKRVDRDTKKMQVELKTRSEGIPLAEAVIILEGWVKRVKEELQSPYTKHLKFGKK